MALSTAKFTRYIQLTGSFKDNSYTLDSMNIDPTENIEVTIVVKDKLMIVQDSNKIRLSRMEYEKIYTCKDSRVDLLAEFATWFNLKILAVQQAPNNLLLSGQIAQFEKAFRTQLKYYTDEGGHRFRGRAGYIQIPAELEAIVDGIYGLDNRQSAKPYFAVSPNYGTFVPPNRRKGYFPIEVAKLYNFPTGVDGAGQCIGIIALGGGYRIDELKKYFTGQGLPMPDISYVSINGAENSPSVPNSDDKEVLLDIQVAGSVAPGAKIVVYFAPNNDKGFLDAVTRAIHDKKNKPTAISICWGSPERKWTRQSFKAFNDVFKAAATLGITICVATGDSGSSDGVHDGKVHVDFPASSPYVLACGGTHLVAKNGKVISEVAWHESDHAAGGGGISEVFPLPDYQATANVPLCLNPSKHRGRGVPDVAGSAAYSNGYRILVNGYWMVLGGTSAVAPLYAGLIALLNQANGTSLGFVNQHLYANPMFFREIIKGNNITARPNLGYTARPGWNACTGLGVMENFMAPL
jgi:kumamolisin